MCFYILNFRMFHDSPRRGQNIWEHILIAYLKIDQNLVFKCGFRFSRHGASRNIFLARLGTISFFWPMSKNWGACSACSDARPTNLKDPTSNYIWKRWSQIFCGRVAKPPSKLLLVLQGFVNWSVLGFCETVGWMFIKERPPPQNAFCISKTSLMSKVHLCLEPCSGSLVGGWSST